MRTLHLRRDERSHCSACDGRAKRDANSVIEGGHYCAERRNEDCVRAFGQCRELVALTVVTPETDALLNTERPPDSTVSDLVHVLIELAVQLCGRRLSPVIRPQRG